MCELFGVSSNESVKAEYLLKEFFSKAKMHPDGWGVAWYSDEKLAGMVKEPVPANRSKLPGFFAERVESKLIIAHIRKKSRGSHLSYVNTHPFVRRLWGKDLVFAHNGDVPHVKKDPKYKLKTFFPAGETDSEHAFCYMLESLSASQKEGLKELAEEIWKYAEDVGSLGKFNFLLSDGEYLLAYMNRERTLHYLLNPVSLKKNLNDEKKEKLKASVISTEKLTDEDWIQMQLRTLYIFRDGELVFKVKLE
jgi:glutamine amidotransferase